jgi:hypothetical protein
MRTRSAVGGLAVCLMLLQAGVADAADKPIEHFTCFAANLSKGTGQLAGAARVTFNKSTNHIEIESYASRPIDLINVKSEKS